MAADTYCTTATSKVGKITKKKTQTTDLCATLWCFIGVVHFFICNETAFNFVSKREEKETTRLFQFCHFCLCIV